jgi:STE24 endopeptidase
MEPVFNTISIILLIALLLLWNLDLVATLLNLKSLRPEVPGEFKEVYDAEKYARSQEYTRAGARFEIFTSAIFLSALLVFWFLGGFRFVDDLARGIGGNSLYIGLTFFALIAVIDYLLHLPFEIYDTFVIEERFGFNKTTVGTFIADQVKSAFLVIVIGLPVAALILWIFENVAHAWIWAWAFFTVFSLLLTYLAPSVILPLFNKFEPMPDGELKSAIQRMAASCEFPLAEVSVMDGSRRSAKSNAFFTGFGKRKKIALYDTLIDQQSEAELVAVLAHEIGHFKRRHILQRMVLSVLQTAVIFYLLGLATDPTGSFAGQLADAFGVAPSYHVGFVLFLILFKPVSRLLGIAMNAWSRRHEFEADAFAAEAQGSSAPLVSALKKLSADNLSNLTPHPLPVLLDHSHPPVLQRIRVLENSAISTG